MSVYDVKHAKIKLLKSKKLHRLDWLMITARHSSLHYVGGWGVSGLMINDGYLVRTAAK